MREDLKFFSNQNPDAPFIIEMTGMSYCDGTYMIERRNSDIIVVEYVIKGTGTIVFNNHEYTASAGEVYVLNKGTDYKYFSSAEDPWEKVFFNLRGEVVESLVKAYRLADKVVLPGNGVYDLFMKAYKISRSDRPIQEILSECAVALHRVFQKLYENIKEQSDHSAEAITLREYLDSRVEQNVSIEDLAKSIYRSKDYVIKLFKKEFGVTPYSYLMEKKLEAASYMLLNSKSSIKQIAYSLGYEDQHYFSNAFKKKYHMSPRQYRQENK